MTLDLPSYGIVGTQDISTPDLIVNPLPDLLLEFSPIESIFKESSPFSLVANLCVFLFYLYFVNIK